MTLGGIDRDKQVEIQKKDIANVVRERIVVEKSVAAEEEQIKDIRTVALANREKEVVRIGAEAAATEVTTKQVKAAQASEEVAKIKARERVVTAEAELDTADKLARAKIRIAEGVQAESAAEGLAKRAWKKPTPPRARSSLTDARVALEKLSARRAAKKRPVGQVRVREAEAQVVESKARPRPAPSAKKLTGGGARLGSEAESMRALR